ncbi:BQ5605_C115g13250 [Microbotryum silenes-dioicae]|uniref:BQ5605_C034g11361 protein n=1 Tax=Microbotryum silenes-dioicae TaxID=796604 RepID=A0A2X0MGS9_9BASI|nr:BQ5605_C034g11361 [Microbotryum silenes-dioicae]SGZ29343.1 BQ5605_C054g12622 [Microbotryum silenes-dioicae]SGZ30109.1 BQ5605_C115g13250 [Microbotryum silenes-dioicae]
MTTPLISVRVRSVVDDSTDIPIATGVPITSISTSSSSSKALDQMLRFKGVVVNTNVGASQPRVSTIKAESSSVQLVFSVPVRMTPPLPLNVTAKSVSFHFPSIWF